MGHLAEDVEHLALPTTTYQPVDALVGEPFATLSALPIHEHDCQR